MAAAGIVGEYKGSQAREVLITLAEYETICKQMARDAAAGYRDLQEEETEPVMKDIEGEEPEDGLEETDEADEVKEEEYEYIKEDVGS
jgi:HEAT repeat protein